MPAASQSILCKNVGTAMSMCRATENMNTEETTAMIAETMTGIMTGVTAKAAMKIMVMTTAEAVEIINLNFIYPSPV